MKIYRSFITPARPIEVDEDVSFKGFDFAPFFPLLGIEACHLTGEITKDQGRYFMDAHVEADLLLSDARDGERFAYPIDYDEYFELLEDELGEEEGYVFPKNLIEPRDIAFALLRSQVPMKPLKEGSILPQGGEGVYVYEEGDRFELGENDEDIHQDEENDDL